MPFQILFIMLILSTSELIQFLICHPAWSLAYGRHRSNAGLNDITPL